MNYSQYNQQNGAQQQQYQQYGTQQDQEEQAIIQYYIYQDFQNIMNLLFSFKTIKEYFASDPKHPAITISKKKLTLQLNISNSIHFDLERTHKNPYAQHCIYEEKCKVKNMLKNFENEIGPDQTLIKSYIDTNLSQNVQIKQLYLEQPQDFTFNENLLNQLIPQVEQIDQQIQNVKQAKKYHIPSEYEIRSKAIEFQTMTWNKLQQSYPYKNSFPPDSRGPQAVQRNVVNQFQNYQNIANNNSKRQN